MKKNLGFTLIELLVVISIISVLSSIILASIQEARDKAKGVAFRMSVDQFIKAIELRKLDTNGVLPTTQISRAVTGNYFETHNDINAFNTNFGNYISDFPKPPFPNEDGSIAYFFYYINDKPQHMCDGKNIFLLVFGKKNIKYFSDWTDWSGGIDAKCYPLQ